MTLLEHNLCKCIAVLMNGTEPDWDTLEIPKGYRLLIEKLAKAHRVELAALGEG